MKNKLKPHLLKVLTVTYGNALVFLRPKRAKQLSEEGMTLILNKMSITDRLMRAAILRKLEQESDYKTLETLHQNYWENKGDAFFSATESRFENDFLPNWSFVFDLLKEELANQNIQFKTLVEIGTGNGSVLNYLCSELAMVDHFVGLDLSAEQIKKNNEKYKSNARLEFVASDGFEWVKKHGQGHTIFVTSGGVLEYFTENRLTEFLHTVNSLGKVMFIAIEPKGIDHDFGANPNTEVYGSERSFSHNYPKLFKDAGFNLWHSSYKPFSPLFIMGFFGIKN